METRLARARKAGMNRLNLQLAIDLGHIHIRSSELLQAYTEWIDGKEKHLDVSIVDIQLHDKWDQPIRRISDLLRHTPSLDTLRIHLRKPSVSKGLLLFRGITLNKLECLSCSNIHHRAVAQFVDRHHKLRSLSVGRCTGGICALNAPSPGHRIEEITGPSPCIYGLVSKTTKVLQVVWDPSNTSEDKDAMLFARVKAIQANVSLLSTQFFPEDVKFTAKISDAFPGLSTLKLVEAPSQTERHIPYPWNVDGDLWTEGLKNLASLKRLQVQTTSVPIVEPGDSDHELTLIHMLVGANQVNLMDITLGYSSREYVYESIWQRFWGSEVWTRIAHSKIPQQ